MKGGPIRVTTVSGSPVEMGTAHGRAHATEINEYTGGRVALSGLGTDMTVDELLELAEEMIPAHRRYDEALTEEMLAVGAAAGISPAEAVIVGGYTDFLDTVRAHVGAASVEDNCTSLLVPDSLANGAGFLAQTWDMNASATPHVVMLDIHPDNGPAALVFTTVGCIGQLGMNEAGIAVGINNLTAADGRIGVTWPLVVRKALRQTSFEAAVAAVTDADLAGGHNFLIFDRSGRGVSIEAMPTATHVVALDHGPVIHTNHCLVPATKAVEGARPADLQLNSERRLDHAYDLMDVAPVTVEHLMALTRDERAICRHPEPPYDYESCGAAIMRPGTGEMWACWGVPSENEYERFEI